MDIIDTQNQNQNQNLPSCSLPNDLVFDVLTRVSLESLEQCRIASDEINILTHHSYFMNLFCQRTDTFSGYIVQSFARRGPYHYFVCCGNPTTQITNSLSLTFLPEKVRIEALSRNEGLAFCISSTRNRYYVCKPTTREWVKIRNPKTRFVTRANAMVVLQTRPLHYQIVRFSNSFRQHLRDYTIFCEIFDSITGFWKRAKDINFHGFVCLGKDPSIFTEGAMHWFTNTGEIFAFNVERESWKMISLPKQILVKDDNRTWYPEKKLVQYHGKIAVIDFESDHAELWVMENYTKQIWIKRSMVENKNLINFYASDVVIVREYDKLVVYNSHNQTVTSINIDKFFFSFDILPFKSDYERVF